ncbi:cupin domain-containing protein [Roseateles sp. BYS180W]|uniref:Cupin domain-containing protein n=1 Tax=Roseateles rivi TaxID=3299028 RepID=A0ABW7FTG4_9BURK
MTHPVMNLADVVLDEEEAQGCYVSRSGSISDHIGARQLGYNLTEVPPGKTNCPFHNHHGEEEMFLILEGTGELRFGQQRHALRPMDVVACPAGGPEVAHQILNTGSVPLRYLALSTLVPVEVCEYPDSGKLLAVAGPRGARRVRAVFHAKAAVDYYDGDAGAA